MNYKKPRAEEKKTSKEIGKSAVKSDFCRNHTKENEIRKKQKMKKRGEICRKFLQEAMLEYYLYKK